MEVTLTIDGVWWVIIGIGLVMMCGVSFSLGINLALYWWEKSASDFIKREKENMDNINTKKK